MQKSRNLMALNAEIGVGMNLSKTNELKQLVWLAVLIILCGTYANAQARNLPDFSADTFENAIIVNNNNKIIVLSMLNCFMCTNSI